MTIFKIDRQMQIDNNNKNIFKKKKLQKKS